mgnify:CR=1 FL=1
MTRNGRFSLSQRGDEFYLINDAENLVLDRNQNPIRLVGDDLTGRELEALPGIFDFAIKNGMLNVGVPAWIFVSSPSQLFRL